MRTELKYIENKYSTVYLKGTHLELFHVQVTSKSLDFLCGFPAISVTSSASHPPQPFPVVYRFRENVLLTQGVLDSPRCCCLKNFEYELALSSESFKNTDKTLKDKTKQNITADEDVLPWFVQCLSPHFVTIASRHTWNLQYSGNLDVESP